LDASALLLLIKKSEVKATIQLLKDSAILDLTFYEIGNAVWKETTLKYLTEEGAQKLAPLAQIVLKRMNQITATAEDFPEILQIAQNEKTHLLRFKLHTLRKKISHNTRHRRQRTRHKSNKIR